MTSTTSKKNNLLGPFDDLRSDIGRYGKEVALYMINDKGAPGRHSNL